MNKKIIFSGGGTGGHIFPAINLMKHSKINGLDKFLLMPPAYYKYDDEGAYLFYAKIVEKIKDCKIILYNFEKLSGYKFSIDCVEKLEIFNFSYKLYVESLTPII